jgi:nucleotide-binding universal stress UspA family protein
VNSTIRTARRRLHQFIQQHVARFCATVTDAVLVGTPICDQIASYARAHNIDLIVSGTHGHGMLHRFAFGSVSKAILQHAPCPVLLVPTAARPVMPALTPELLTSEALLG